MPEPNRTMKLVDPAATQFTGISLNGIPPGPQSIALLKRMRQVIGRANYGGLYGVCLQKGRGMYLEDADHNVYLDCLAAASSCSLGYGQDFLAQAYTDAVSELQQSCFFYSPNQHAVALAEKLVRITPGAFDKRVLLGLSGSDASGGAIKAMRKFTQNEAIIHFKNDYHGSTGLSQAASDFGNLNAGILPKSSQFIEFDFPASPEQAATVLEQIRHQLTRHKAGGILCEAIQGDAGIQLPPGGFMQELRTLTRETDTLLAIDEVQSGMGRTGKWWSYEHEAIVPDLFVTAKGLSGGYAPISAIIGRQDVLDSLDSGQHLFTYGGHPASAAVAGKVIDYITQHDLLSRVNETGQFLLTELRRVQQAYPDIIVDVRGRGLMIGVQIDVSSYLLAGKVFSTRCVEKGVYVGFFGVNAEVVRIEPPLLMTITEATVLVEVIRDVAHEMQVGAIPKRTYKNVRTYSLGI